MRTIGVNEKLVDLIQQPINPEFLAYVSHQASLVIPCHETATDNKRRKDPLPPLATFIAVLVKRSNIRTGTLLGSLVFLNRLQQRLANIAKGMSCTCHRIFLATLIVTSKAIHDTSPKNKHWTRYAIFFSLGEVNLMEKQLLSLIDYQT
ncbi:uncharacterized protein BYT42DRAFT_532363, partial [Radiomyces spectabilis]|uniref:uncharacterized protein n=1 Tax=Radiomyces spectabilis TaxID=64574 RepID=UPI00221F62A4